MFARWLLKEFSSLNLMIGLSRHLHDGTEQLVRQEYRLRSFRLKKICKDCNNGWMSDLEQAAKPLILGVISGVSPIADLSIDERCVLARWAGKTAIVESHAVGAECPVSTAFLRQIKRDIYRNPGNFATAACKTEYRGFGHMQVGVIRDLIGGGKAAGSVIAIAVPQLAFVCAFPMLEISYQCRLAAPLQGLWPDDARCWHPIKDTFKPIQLNSPQSFVELVERIELFHSVL